MPGIFCAGQNQMFPSSLDGGTPSLRLVHLAKRGAKMNCRLAVDALLDELYVLFSPQVFLLAGLKSLVDEVHHPRIDELCGKARSRGGSDASGGECFSTPVSVDPSTSSAPRTEAHLLSTPPREGGNGAGGSKTASSTAATKASPRPSLPSSSRTGSLNAHTGLSTRGASAAESPLAKALSPPSLSLEVRGVSACGNGRQSGERQEESLNLG